MPFQLPWASARIGVQCAGSYPPVKSTTFFAVTRKVTSVAGGSRGDSPCYLANALSAVAVR